MHSVTGCLRDGERERESKGKKEEREGERERASRLIKMARGREEEAEGRMRDEWLTQS